MTDEENFDGCRQLTRVDGFGACMISGMPHCPDRSFFHQFLRLLETDLETTVHHSTLSLGGFPVGRAAKNFKKALVNHPDFLVVQFGSTDLTVSLKCSLQNRIRQQFHLKPKHPGTKSKSKQSVQLSPFRSTAARKAVELLKSSICRLLSVEPIHGGTDVYKAAMEDICRGALLAGTIPILLAPFPHGDRVSNLWASRFRDNLEEVAQDLGCIFVDTYRGLQHVAKEDLLLEDKLHLSLLGHHLVGELIFEAAGARIARSGIQKVNSESKMVVGA